MRRLFIWLFSLTGIFSYYRKKQKSPMVLFWHDVADGASKAVEGESFPVSIFRSQVLYLKKHYDIISIEEYYKRYQNHAFTNNEVVITFDDGYRNNLLVAAPILKEYGIPFTVFVSANNVDLQKRFYISIPRLVIIGAKLNVVDIPMMPYHKICRTDTERVNCANEIEYTIKYYSHEKAISVSDYLISLIGKDRFAELCKEYPNGDLLTWTDIKLLASEYDCTIGSHCLDHCICHESQDKDLVREQIVCSKRMIEENTGLKCKFFAYPNGDYSEYSNEIVASKYKMGFSTNRTPVYGSKSVASIGRIAAPSSVLLFKYAITMGAKQFR